MGVHLQESKGSPGKDFLISEAAVPAPRRQPNATPEFERWDESSHLSGGCCGPFWHSRETAGSSMELLLSLKHAALKLVRVHSGTNAKEMYQI